MNNIKNKISIFFVALLTCGFWTSCSDDDLESRELVAFLRQWKSETFTTQQTYNTNGEPIILGYNKSIKLPAYISREATVPVQVEIGQSLDMVAVYNESHNTNFQPFPEELVSFANNLVTIPANKLQSVDSIEVNFDMVSIVPGTYLLPLKINQVISKDKGIKPSATAGVVYYQFKITHDYFNEANMDVPQGTKVDKSNWTITSDCEPVDGFPLTNLLDGDRSTDWKGVDRHKTAIVVDMKNEIPLRGFSYHHAGEYRDAPIRFEISVSKDGEKWDLVGNTGIYSFSYSVTDKEYGINFFIPVPCRYFKIKVVSVNSFRYAPRFSELDAFK